MTEIERVVVSAESHETLSGAIMDAMGEDILDAISEHGGAEVTVDLAWDVEPYEMPEAGDRVGTPDGPGEVVWPSTHPDRIRVLVDGRDESVWYDRSEVEW